MAAERLRDLDGMAAPDAWEGLERYLGVTVRRSLGATAARLAKRGEALRAAHDRAGSAEKLRLVKRRLVRFRRHYLRTETTLDFFADAVNTRTTPEISALLRACDLMASKSMERLLDPLGRRTPPVLTYLDKGLGASILKAGLRLWDGGTENPVAMIKVVRHNLYRPTSLVHEAGHQVAHILGWTEELSRVLAGGISRKYPEVAEAWAAWASEIAADVFAFVHTGYASVAALHDVVAGDRGYVFRNIPGDPHPVSYLRVLLGTRMCTDAFGEGPWDGLAAQWKRDHPLKDADPATRRLIVRSLPLLPRISALCLKRPLAAFGGRTISQWIPPEEVGPPALRALAGATGPALYTSPHWALAKPLHLLALTGYQAALDPDRAREALERQRNWMLRLGAGMASA